MILTQLLATVGLVTR